MSQNLDTRAAAAFLAEVGAPISPKTLCKLRVIGGGPRFFKFGRRVVYPTTELERWARVRLGDLRTSTSDTA